MDREEANILELSRLLDSPVGYRRGPGLSGFQLLDSIDLSESNISIDKTQELTSLLSGFSSLESVYVSGDTSTACLAALKRKLVGVRIIVYHGNFELNFETVSKKQGINFE